MTVSGKFVKKFTSATHVLFEGHLDDSGFRAIASQKLKDVSGGHIVAATSGRMKIESDSFGEKVNLVYTSTYNQIFGGKSKTTGRPFKDRDTECLFAAG